MGQVNVALIGTSFMGKAHSNAWRSVDKFFDIGISLVLKVACDVDSERVKAFAENWGWEEVMSDWKQVVSLKEIDIVDICMPAFLHKDMVIAAAEIGKRIFCEKPEAKNYFKAKEMYEIVKKSEVHHYLPHNHR